MPICTVNNLEKTFGQRVMFDQLNFSIDRGERVGLIGDNGSGKTTLFKTIMGELPPDSGSVAIPKTVKVGYLTQSPSFGHDNTLIDEAELAFAQLHELSHKMRDLEHEMAVVEGDALDRVLGKYQDAQHEFDLAGGYAWRHRLEATLLGVGLPEKFWEQKVGTLSGGQKSRLALARLLISEPDLLLLDEPTNHLDLAAVSWLEKYLLEFTGAVLIISHDRYLLDRLATRIVWLTGAKLKSYPGNYSAFVQQREMQELAQSRAYEQQQADIAKQQEFIRRFGAGQRSREAKGREKRLNRLLTSDAMIDAVGTNHHIHLSLNTDQRAGDRVLKVVDLSKSFGSLDLWKDIAFDVDRGERIGIIGPNGSGKTTMLEVLLGKQDADAGDIRWGANLKIGYYDQQLNVFDPENTVMEETRGDRDVKDQELRAVLALMLFRGTDMEKRVDMLSGGERARVAMAQLLLDKPNVMILDEPTNHLDIPSCEALENALQQFPGTILCVSHDRYFLDRTVERLLVLDPPNVNDFEGNYSAWADRQAQQASDAKAQKSAATAKKSANEKKPEKAKPAATATQSQPAKKSDNAWARPFGRLSLPDLEQQIVEAETAVADAQKAMSQRTVDPGRVKQTKSAYEAATKKLEQLEAEYYFRGNS